MNCTSWCCWLRAGCWQATRCLSDSSKLKYYNDALHFVNNSSSLSKQMEIFGSTLYILHSWAQKAWEKKVRIERSSLTSSKTTFIDSCQPHKLLRLWLMHFPWLNIDRHSLQTVLLKMSLLSVLLLCQPSVYPKNWTTNQTSQRFWLCDFFYCWLISRCRPWDCLCALTHTQIWLSQSRIFCRCECFFPRKNSFHLHIARKRKVLQR